MHKVSWKNENPWYREIKDGFSWFCYCMNRDCEVYKQLVVINRGYTTLSMNKEALKLTCPVCKKGNKKGPNGEKPTLLFRNCGYVNCEWTMRGTLEKNQDSKIFADGRTYDNKLYTFKEIDYRETWHELTILIQKIDPKNGWKNLPSNRKNEPSENRLDSNGLDYDEFSDIN